MSRKCDRLRPRPWPSWKACASKRLTPEYRTPEKKACYGLLPESMSHEGYMAHPVHAYWDDFWAVRGIRDAALMAEVLGDARESARLSALQESFSKDLRASLAATMEQHKIDFVPGSVEFADFDPTATSVAIGLLDQLHLLPAGSNPPHIRHLPRRISKARERRGELEQLQRLRDPHHRRPDRLGRRQEALELTRFMLADRRIRPWNQWPEISWRDPLGPSFIGDLPHTWISAEYILAVRAMFAYEREADDSLVIAAGIDKEWLKDGFAVGVRNLPTYYGKLSYSLRRESDRQPAPETGGRSDRPARWNCGYPSPPPAHPAGAGERPGIERVHDRPLHVQGMPGGCRAEILG